MLDIESKPAGLKSVYQLLSQQVRAIVEGEEDALANLSNVASLLYHSLDQVNWVGFYIARENELVLGPFQGKPACVRIPFGRGVCGTVAQEGKALLVDDVLSFPGHIACDAESRSEVVIPLFQKDKQVAVLDIDSPVANRFSEIDLEGLSHIALDIQKSSDFSQLLY